MHEWAAFVADVEPTKAMQPRQRPFDDPPRLAQAAAVGRLASGEERDDTAGAELVSMPLGVVAAIALEAVRALPRASRPSAQRRYRLDQGQELRDVITVGRCQMCDQRNATRIGQNVMFRPFLAAIGRVRSSFFPRATRGARHYPRGRGGDRVGHAAAVLRGARCAAAPIRRPVATARAVANTSSPTRSPFLVGACSRECHFGGRRECPSAPPDPECVGGRRGGLYPGESWATAVQPEPTGHRQGDAMETREPYQTHAQRTRVSIPVF
jgi:hypothetical protein